MSGHGVQSAGLVRVDEERLDLGGEPELSLDARPEERLLARAVAREDQRCPAIVPNGEAEHPLEPSDRARPVPLVEGDNVLDVTLRAERVPPPRGFAPEVARVVDLAVADHPDAAVGALKRLVAGREVHDGEGARAEARALMPDDALSVRTAVLQRGRHLRDAPRMPERLARQRDGAEDAAHHLTPFEREGVRHGPYAAYRPSSYSRGRPPPAGGPRRCRCPGRRPEPGGRG